MPDQKPVVSSLEITLTERELHTFQKLIFEWAGIHMTDAKNSLIAGRLLKRLRIHQFSKFQQYIDLILDPKHADEKQIMINLLTTNETYFFREDAHLDFIHDILLLDTSAYKRSYRVWSAASSSGQEAYSIGIILAERFGLNGWEILGTDINEDVLTIARNGVYPIQAAEKVPQKYLKKYCLKGVREQEGKFTIVKELKNNISFKKINLNEPFMNVGLFDLVILRNVMIYFNIETKQQLIDRIYDTIKPMGYFIIGHSENLNSLEHKFNSVRPTIYRKV